MFGEEWNRLKEGFSSGDPLPWIKSKLLASKAKQMEYPIAIAAQRGRAVLRQEPKLVVGTVHSVKGGQADTVIVLPDLSPQGIKQFVRPGEGRDGIIRTFYVAMTRAKERLVLAGRWSPSSVDWNH